MRYLILFGIGLWIYSAVAGDTVLGADLQTMLDNRIAEIQALAAKAEIIAAVKAQNAKAIPAQEIQALDQEWQASTEQTPLKASL